MEKYFSMSSERRKINSRSSLRRRLWRGLMYRKDISKTSVRGIFPRPRSSTGRSFSRDLLSGKSSIWKIPSRSLLCIEYILEAFCTEKTLYRENLIEFFCTAKTFLRSSVQRVTFLDNPFTGPLHCHVSIGRRLLTDLLSREDLIHGRPSKGLLCREGLLKAYKRVFDIADHLGFVCKKIPFLSWEVFPRYSVYRKSSVYINPYRSLLNNLYRF